jgi:ribosome-interacting GTPase 1
VDKLFYVFDQFVRNSPDEAKRIFAESGADVELVDKALEKIGVHEATVKLRDATLNEYIDVLLRDGMYITTIPYRVEDGKLVAPIKTYGVTKDSDALSPTQKRHLGLLKLTENGTFIPNVGFRFSDNEFRIFV